MMRSLLSPLTESNLTPYRCRRSWSAARRATPYWQSSRTINERLPEMVS